MSLTTFLRRLIYVAPLAALLLLGPSFLRAKDEAEKAEAPLYEADKDGKVEVFNGKDLTGFDANPKFWSVDKDAGEIVGKATENHDYDYLTTQKAVADFRLVLKIKLTPNKENSGVQVRSSRIGKVHMKGPQFDVGQGWWGHIYDEHGLALVTKTNGEKFVKIDDWNTYEIVCVGSRFMSALNGNKVQDFENDKLSKRGIIGIQLHAGGPQEVRLKDISLELNPKAELITVK
jgi:hypothetical protein